METALPALAASGRARIPVLGPQMVLSAFTPGAPGFDPEFQISDVLEYDHPALLERRWIGKDVLAFGALLCHLLVLFGYSYGDMITNRMMGRSGTTDMELVTQSLDGDRNAFGQIIARYQSLVCSLAYSATGSLGQSEDIAQETFITAWKHLGHLRERDKLRAWLCGIARFLIGKAIRRDGREPIHAAEPLDVTNELPAPGLLPSEHTINPNFMVGARF